MGIAAYYAELYQAEVIIEGLILEDEGKFPDDSPQYFQKIEELIKFGLPPGPWKGPHLVFPFRNMKKDEILQLALDMKVPLEFTWSCFIDNNGIPCGDCLPCKQREDGFKKLGFEDPIWKRIRQ